MQAPNQSRLNSGTTNIKGSPTKGKPKKRQRTSMFSSDKTGKSQLVPVGNQAPWTIGGPSMGGKGSSKANAPRKKTIKNKAPKKRVPIMGNTGTMGMMGF